MLAAWVRGATLRTTAPPAGAVQRTAVRIIQTNSANLTVIDQRTEEPVWVMDFELGVRPMAFEQNPDGSTRRMFVQLTEFNGFAVVDFATRKEVTRVALPQIAAGKKPVLREVVRIPDGQVPKRNITAVLPYQ